MLFTLLRTLLSLLMLLCSGANPVADDLSLDSLDIFSSPSESQSEASLNPGVHLDTLSSGSDLGVPFTLEGTTDQDSVLIGAEDCLTVNGQLRKRDGAICPAPRVVESSNLGIFGDSDDEDLVPPTEEERKRDPLLCTEIWLFFGRIFDVCCDGPYGPFVIDPDVRLIYNYISNCYDGKFKLGISYYLLPLNAPG